MNKSHANIDHLRTVVKFTSPFAAFKECVIRFIGMNSYYPILTNLMALGLCVLTVYLLQVKWLFPKLGLLHYLIIATCGFLAIVQILRSARKSLLLPSTYLIVPSIILFLRHYSHFNLTVLPTCFLQEIAFLELIGLCISIFYIK